jgi:hypothetical protein
MHKFCDPCPASTLSSSVDPLADRTTSLSSPIDRGQVPYQMLDHTVCSYLVGTSDDQLRASNDQVSSSVRSMPLSSDGHALRWNADGPAQIFTVICCDELHGRGIAKTIAETCARDLIVGLRKYAALASVWQLDSFWFFCRQTP